MSIPIIKIHYDLIMFLRKELKKKRTIKQTIFFLRDVAKQYYKVVLHEYKMFLMILTDAKYRKTKKDLDRRQQLAKDLINGLRCLLRVEEGMREAGIKKHVIKHFYRDFIEHEDMREKLIKQLIIQIEQELKGFK